MPLDLRKMHFTESRSGTPVPTTDSLVDTLEDPLEAHKLGTMDKAKDTAHRASSGLSKAMAKMRGKSSPADEPSEVRQAKVEKMIQDIAKVGIAARCSYLRRHFSAELRAFMTGEYSIENLDFVEALDSGTSDEEIIATYIRVGSSDELNLSGHHREQAMRGGSGLRVTARIAAERLIGGDVWARMSRDPVFRTAVANRL